MKINKLSMQTNGTSTGQAVFMLLNISTLKTNVRDKVCPVHTGQGLSP